MMDSQERRRLLLGLAEGAEALGVKRSTMYDLLARGEIESVKIGKRRLVTAESLEAYVERLKEAQ